jgi:hypothetical protein
MSDSTLRSLALTLTLAGSLLCGCAEEPLAPCARLSCPPGWTCDPDLAACVAEPRPTLDDVDLGVTNLAVAGPQGATALSYSRADRCLYAVDWPGGGAPLIRAVTAPGSGLGRVFSAARDGEDRLSVLLFDPASGQLHLSAPFHPEIPTQTVPLGTSVSVVDPPALAWTGERFEAIVADTTGALLHLRVEDEGVDTSAVMILGEGEETRERPFRHPSLVPYAGRTYLFYQDLSDRAVRMAAREGDVWQAETVVPLVAMDDQRPFDAAILDDGRALVLARGPLDSALSLSVRDASGRAVVTVDAQAGPLRLAHSIGWFPRVTVSARGDVFLGDYDATAHEYRVRPWSDALGAVSRVPGPLLHPSLIIQGDRPRLIAGALHDNGAFWQRRLTIAELP